MKSRHYNIRLLLFLSAVVLMAFGQGCKTGHRSISRTDYVSGADSISTKKGRVRLVKTLPRDSVAIIFGDRTFMTKGETDTLRAFIYHNEGAYQREGNKYLALYLVIKPYRVIRNGNKVELQTAKGIRIKGKEANEVGEIIIPIEELPGFSTGILKYPFQVENTVPGSEYQLSINIRAGRGTSRKLQQRDNIWSNGDKVIRFPMLTGPEADDETALRKDGITDRNRFKVRMAKVKGCELLCKGARHELEVTVSNAGRTYDQSTDRSRLFLRVMPFRTDKDGSRTKANEVVIGGYATYDQNQILLNIPYLNAKDTTVLRFPIETSMEIPHGPLSIDMGIEREGASIEARWKNKKQFDFTVLTGNWDEDDKLYSELYRKCGFKHPECNLQWKGKAQMKEKALAKKWEYTSSFGVYGAGYDQYEIEFILPNGSVVVGERGAGGTAMNLSFETTDRLEKETEIVVQRIHKAGFPIYTDSVRFTIVP